MTTKTRQRQSGLLSANDPTPWAADLTHCPATATPSVRTGTRPPTPDASSGASDLIPIATIAGGSCRPAETAGGDTVATPASNGPHAADAPSVSLSASADTVAIRLPIPNVSRPCEQCGHTFAPRRPWGRFCSAYCRRLAWLGRNPEKAAELAERDKARLRAHVIGNGGTWEEVH